jgi:hypothetical protein
MATGNKDTTAAIWGKLYTVRVPSAETSNLEYIRIYGTPITGDKGIDNTLAHQFITTMLPISKMVEYFKRGVPVKVVVRSDIKEIYTAISEHLQAWMAQLQNGINIGNAPLADLIAMDEFANTVFEHARYQFTQSMVDSALYRNMSGITGLSRESFFKKKDTGPMLNRNGSVMTDEERNDVVYPKRESMADMFSDVRVSNHWPNKR